MKRVHLKNIFTILSSVFLGMGIYITFDRSDLLYASIPQDPIEGYYPPIVPHYPGVTEFPLGEEMKIGKANFKMSYFITSDSIMQVANFYIQYWEGLNLFVYKDISSKFGIVSAIDPKTENIASVTMVTKENYTLVFPTLINAKEGKLFTEWPKNIEDKVAIFPHSSKGLFLSSTDNRSNNFALVYYNNEGIEKNLKFIKQRMGELGWKLLSSDSTKEIPNTLSLYFSKGKKLCIINLTYDNNKVYVYITYEEDMERYN